MHMGPFVIHPLTVPFAHELTHSVSCAINQGMLVYNCIIKPEIMELQEIIKLL